MNIDMGDFSCGDGAFLAPQKGAGLCHRGYRQPLAGIEVGHI